MGRSAPLTSKGCILYIYSTNIDTEYFQHVLYSPFFSLQNAVCFIMLNCLVPVLFTFYIQDELKLKKKFRRQRVKVHTLVIPMGSHGLHLNLRFLKICKLLVKIIIDKMYKMMVSEQGQNVGLDVLWYHLVRG